jgi:tRNA (guanine37-N1)-methyltransferase
MLKVFKDLFTSLRMANYDIIGNIAIVKFKKDEKLRDKKKFAEKFLKEHKAVKTVLEESKFKGRLRTKSPKHIAGEKTREILYKENGCLFRLNIDTCYFSPRLSTERLELAKKVKKDENVLVMFGGVAPYAIVISKHSKAKKITSVEISRECNKYARENVKRNRLHDIEIVQGDVKRKVPELGKFDRVIMAPLNLKRTFYDIAFRAVKPKGTLHCYGFYPEEEKKNFTALIKSEAKKAKRKIKILKVKKAGEVGTRKYRFRADLKVS